MIKELGLKGKRSSQRDFPISNITVITKHLKGTF